MPSDVESLLRWSRVVLTITAVCVTLFPVLYGLIAPWYRSHLGRAVLLQSVSVALAIDISAYAQFWTLTSDIQTMFVINLVFLGFICLASLYLTATLLYINMRKFNRENYETQQFDV
jgi:hypothetical protein